jgi:uncharacterized membrane protein (DUF485 family)
MIKCQMKPDRQMLQKQCTVICLLGFVLFLFKQAYKTERLGAEVRQNTMYNSCN